MKCWTTKVCAKTVPDHDEILLDSTPLHYAASHDCLEAAEVLIVHDAFVDATGEDHNTPLTWAAAVNSTRVAKALIMACANTELSNKWEQSARLLANENNYTQILEMLDGKSLRKNCS